MIMRKRGIIHADIKPQNIMRTQEGAQLIDFGSAVQKKNARSLASTASYKPPEQILGMDCTNSVDIWGLACVVAEVALGRRVFSGRNDAENLAIMVRYLGYPSL